MYMRLLFGILFLILSVFPCLAQSYTPGEKVVTIRIPDGKKTVEFKIPNEDLYRYSYADTGSVFGSVSLLDLNNKEDLLWVGNLCLQARKDARNHYKMHQASTAGVTALSIINPIFGLAIVLPVTKTSPRYENLGISEVDLLQDRIYYDAYAQEAKKMKNKRAWIGFGVGSVVSIGILTGIILAVTK